LGISAAAFLRFVQSMTRFWRSQPILHRRNFFQGRPIRGAGVSDVSWFTPGGEELKDEDWEKPVKVLGVRFAGDLIQEKDERGRPITGDTLFAIFNAGPEPVEFVLPPTDPRHEWERVIDTTTDHPRPDVFPGGHRHFTDARSVAVFRTRAQSVS
jgi:isoamylase